MAFAACVSTPRSCHRETSLRVCSFWSELTFLLVLKDLFQALLPQFPLPTAQAASCWSLTVLHHSPHGTSRQLRVWPGTGVCVVREVDGAAPGHFLLM